MVGHPRVAYNGIIIVIEPPNAQGAANINVFTAQQYYAVMQI